MFDCPRDLQVKFTDDQEIAKLNTNFLGLPGPTNVLSFPAGDTGKPSGGYIVVSGEAVLREAFMYFQTPGEHTVRLISHGLLHLRGFEHGALMEDLTEKAIDRIYLLMPDQFQDMDIFY